MNHNELVGWSHPYPEVAVVIFKDSDENPRNKLRMNFCMEIFRNLAGKVIEIPSEGSSTLEKKLCWIHLVDWVSVYLAELRNVDTMDIRVIDKLKGELATH
jgi:hypothetical protein